MKACSISAMEITFLIATFTALIVLCSSAAQIDPRPEVDKLSSPSLTKRSSDSEDLESAASDRSFFGYGGGVPYGISTTFQGTLSPGYKGYYPGITGGGNTGYGYYGTGGYGGYGSGYGGYGSGYGNSIGYGSGYSGYGNGYGGYGGYVSGIGSYGGLDDSYGNRGYGSQGYGGYGIYGSLGGYGGLYGNRGSYYGSPSGYRGYSK